MEKSCLFVEFKMKLALLHLSAMERMMAGKEIMEMNVHQELSKTSMVNK
jgi:hypothetical protein